MMTKITYYLCLLLLLAGRLPVIAQSQPASNLLQQLNQARQLSSTPNYALFSPTATANYNTSRFKPGRQPVALSINTTTLNRIISEQPDLLTFTIPAGQETLELELVPVDLFAPTSKLLIGTGTGVNEAPINRGLFYQGFVKNKTRSLVSISIINGELSGFVADETGNRSLSRLRQSPTSYLFYRDNTINTNRTFVCSTDDSNGKAQPQVLGDVAPASISCKVVNIYLEADYQTYISNESNVVTTTNYITALFNQVATIYNRENIAVRIAGIKVWTVSDPYAETSNTNTALSAFVNYQNSNPPPGIDCQLSHLLSTRDIGGGRAYIDVLCSSSFKYGVSGNLSTTYQDFPNYSWEVMVVAHELGHNFGSPHTQSCSWPGGALDDCYAPEGSCPPGPTPANGGTIMSYCHLTSYGINLVNGFGTLPGNLIRSRVASQVCIPSASDVPTNLAIKDITATSVTVYWVSNSGSTNFTIQYRPASATTWTTVGPFVGVRRTLTGLQPNTGYVWRVTGECSGSYSAEASFTTGQPIYCTPLYSNNGCGFGIGLSQVVLNNTALSINSGCAPNYYSFYSAQTGTLSKSTPNTFVVDFLGYFNPQHIAIWIDFDESYNFEDNELVFATTQQYTSPVSNTFSVPTSAPDGVTRRMRVRNQYFSPANTACGTLSYGETEDYLVYIQPECPPTLTLTMSATTATCLQSTTLSVANCTGTVEWLPSGTGNTLVVNPTQTTSYTAICVVGSCRTSRTATLTVAPDMTSKRSGTWTDPAVWSCNRVPSSTSPLAIRAGHVITLPANYTGSAKSLSLFGKINFQTGAKLKLNSFIATAPALDR